MMPELDGYQVLEVMKADIDLRNVVVIMISAVDQIESVVRCIELGASDYLTKPFNPALLKARIDTYVQKSQYRAQEIAYHERVEAEKRRADQLLKTLLPQQVARVLKANNKLVPVRYDDVAVLFCDIVGFTAYSESRPPEVVFSQLEGLIENFEDLVAARNLVKIKTIGDALMVTGGLLEEVDDPVYRAVDCAFEMISVAARSEAGWRVRIGIDYGPVVAGVIGRTSFQFDVWGDTVNTAARIENVGAPGTINVSGRAWHQLRGRARGRSIGMVDLKGKAPIEIVECQALK
jgi:class 3 adenylate cyclase